MEAFSDGVLAIIITIMVLEMRAPPGDDLESLRSILPVFLSYVLSFAYLGIYWNNHHHMLQTVKHVTGPILWANLHLLFWLSLIPFATAWMDENHLKPTPTALYGFILLMAGLAYVLLQTLIIRSQGPRSLLKQAVGDDWKGKASAALYAVALGAAFVLPWIAVAVYVGVALMWLAPDRRIETTLSRGRE